MPFDSIVEVVIDEVLLHRNKNALVRGNELIKTRGHDSGREVVLTPPEIHRNHRFHSALRHGRFSLQERNAFIMKLGLEG